MSTPILSSTELQPFIEQRPTAVLMLRTPVPPSQGTDPYHDTFGPFCLPSFPLSALESGSSTPLPPPISVAQMSSSDRSGADLLRSALNASATGRRKGRWIDDATLTTHHLASDPDAITTDQGQDQEVPKREYCVTSIPILGHRVLNSDELADRLMYGTKEEGGLRREYRGAIITSQRAVEAWAEAEHLAAPTIREGKKPVTNWPRKPIFAVGPSTGEALRSLAKQMLLPLRTSLVMGAGATGTGELLATYIVRHFNGPSGAAPGQSLETVSDQPPLLYLTGDKNASTIRDALQSCVPPIPIDELMVYETCLDPAFAVSCEALSRSLPPLAASRPGSRRSSRSGSNSSSRRPSVGSLFGPGVEKRKSSFFASSSEGRPTNLNPTGLTGPLTAMTPFSTTPIGDGGTGMEPTGSPVMVASPITEEDGFSFPLDTDIGLGTGSGTKPDWIVFFSPSGLQYALEDLRRKQWIPRAHTFNFEAQEYAKDSPESKERREKWLGAGPPEGYPRIAVLGPTTKRWVRQHLGFQPDAVAATPGATELREAIRMAERRIRREHERRKGEKEDIKKKNMEDKARLVGLSDGGGGIPMDVD